MLAAHSGDTIKVEPGTYREQVTIPSTTSDLTLVSEKPLAAVIQPPSGSQYAVADLGARDFTLDGFTVAGPVTGLVYGVAINGGSATIERNHITAIHDQPLSGNQSGVAAAVLNGGTAQIRSNLIDDYQKGGIVVDGTASSADVAANVVKGIGPTSVVVQNGIQFSRGATGTVKQNTVSGNEFTGTPSDAGVGIYLFQAGQVSVVSNTVFASDENIAVDTTAGAVLNKNESYGATSTGIGLFGATKAAVTGNYSHDNAQYGIFVDELSANNSIVGNRFTGNGLFDAVDLSTGSGTSGTANLWKHNRGRTSSPPGLFGPNGGKAGGDNGRDNGGDDDGDSGGADDNSD